MAETLDRPVVTLPPQETALLIATYQPATVILEYGTGGSTLVAADQPGRQIFAVESSAMWCAKMAVWFQDHPPKSPVHLHYANIGKTRDWGFPVDASSATRWSDYPVSVWDRADFVHPDVVLIDGRFRLACALTVLFRITRPVTVLIDDYTGRPNYAKIELLAGPPQMVGRMAKFEFAPQPMPAAHMQWIMAAFANPN